MKPGDVVTCSSCGAEGRVWTSSHDWREGQPLLVTWTNGPHPRHTTSSSPPELCLWCDDRRLGFPSLQGRPLPSEAPWTAGGPRCTYEIPAIGVRAVEHPAAPAGTVTAIGVVDGADGKPELQVARVVNVAPQLDLFGGAR